MENSTKALIMVANLMLAVMVLTIIVYFFQNMKALPEQQDEAKRVEEIRKFNQEYEVFDKKLMYGVDVISALNKADSNNEKYVKGNFLSGSKKGEEFIIDIVVTLTSSEPLSDTITVNYLDTSNEIDENNTTGYTKERAYTTNQGPGGITLGDLTKYNLKLPSDTYAKTLYNPSIDFKNKKLWTQTFETTIKADTYHLLDTSKFKANGEYTEASISENTILKLLISMSDSISQRIKNTDIDDDKRKATDYNTATENWSSMEWKTALYDLKTRKFKCVETDESGNETSGIHYNATTGVIDRISFVEY